ncbi:unnamed protein product [Rotaria sp. Silwood1]|nr:unnamed protein product [Rotaria sp. Silwood1]CAF3434138.1 unnamed protein product [Rotaria sp. Silwood1]CAF3456140.1 unnamed protein product [Rotaria sp. Silwood1]CAF3461338.1 unnamed protein product [Rotaria sp. Silwood1]CAF4694750.1 unnamed protein product [Rotaria sp. Silwood1]
MTPGTKRTIITSKTTGRRYFLVRSANRPSGRRYYVCTNPNCKARVTREADLYCKIHAQDQQAGNEDIANISTKSDQIDENDIQDNGEVIDEESSTAAQQNTTTEASLTEEPNESANNDSMHEDDVEDINDNIQTDTSTAFSINSHSNRQIQVDEATGVRSFRDNSGRRRYLCMHDSCQNALRRQSDVFCRLHLSNGKQSNESKTKRRGQKRHSAPPSTNSPKKNRYRSPFQTSTITATTIASENGTDGNQSDEYEAPKKNTPQRPGTNRSFRDGSGKLRFLCSVSGCQSRVPRQSEAYCRRHRLELEVKESTDNNIQPATTNGTINEEKMQTTEEMNVPENDINTSSRQTTSETEIQSESKKRKRESSIVLSSIVPNKIVIATTALLDDQWNEVLAFLRQFPQVQLSTNLNVNNSTTHLLVDDSENNLHCTITKKIVQAAVRHHIFILSSRWLNECMSLNKFVDEHPYEIVSDSHTTLRLSEQNINQINNKYLFGQNSQYSYAFAIECRQCQGSINRSELIELIQLTGAQLFQNEQAVDVLIVLCDTSDKNINKIKEKYMNAPASNIKYVTSDFLLKSIIKFEIQDIDKYSL